MKPYDEHFPDYEVELAIVVGKPAKNVSENDALDYILGFTGANDVSRYSLSLRVKSERLYRYPSESGSNISRSGAFLKALMIRILWGLSWSVKTPSVMSRM